jgi:hypothetical protein
MCIWVAQLSPEFILHTYAFGSSFVHGSAQIPAQLLDGQALGLMAQTRLLNVHEYVGMEIMKKYDVAVPRGGVASTPAEAEHIYNSFIGGIA